MSQFHLMARQVAYALANFISSLPLAIAL